MILQELVNYYDRKAEDSGSGIAPLGWEWKDIAYIICVDASGTLINVEYTLQDGHFKPMLVPKSIPRSGVKSFATTFFLWDHRGYVLGYPASDEKAAKQHETWSEGIKRISSLFPDVTAIQAVRKFCERPLDLRDPIWAECLKDPINRNCVFRVNGKILYEYQDVRDAYASYMATSVNGEADRVKGICLVSGMRANIARTHHDTPISKDSKKFVSFQKGCGYDSYGKLQAYNAPVSAKAEFAYTTALNSLLNSQQKLRVGDATVVFWAEKDDSFESAFASFFEEPPKDNPDALVDSVRALYRSPQTGVCVLDEDKTRFFVLGLAPSSVRIAVRFWQTGTVAELSARFRQYFDDLMVVHGPKDRDHLSLWRLLVSTAQQEKSENVNPNLAGAFMRSVLEGRQFPETLIQAVLVRVKAEREVGYSRAKLIKGYLCRKLNLTSNERSKLVSLNRDNNNIGYRLGRLFATLEKIQNDANPGINATIRDRFYAAASSSPVTVFGNLMRMSNHWLSKVESEKPGLAVVRKKLLGEIMEGLSAFPAHLAIADQGFFALGYYHQQQDFFTKKQSDESEQN